MLAEKAVGSHSGGPGRAGSPHLRPIFVAPSRDRPAKFDETFQNLDFFYTNDANVSQMY
jgi:hypothetical protein